MSILSFIILIYFLLIAGVGIYARFQIHSPDDFYIAGKKGGLFQVTGSLLATILGGSAIIGTLELSQANGWASIWFLTCASLGLLILAPISKYVSRYGKFTLPGLLGHFYGIKAEKIASAVIPFAWLGIIAAQIIAAAKILSSTGLMEYTSAALISGAVFILYTLLGGQKSILKTDLVQSAIILLSLSIIFVLIAGQNGYQVNPEKINGLFNSKFSMLDLLILILTYSTTFIVGPDIYSRIFCASSEKIALKSVFFTALILLPFAFILTYLGIHTPQEEGGVAGILLYWQGNLPVWVSGLLLAALLAAVMSSADTTLLTASMIFSELIFGQLSNNKSYKATKIFIVLIGALSLMISLFVTSVIQSLLLALSFFSGAFFVPMLAGLLKWNVHPGRIVAAILAGGIFALCGKLISMHADELAGNLIIIASFILNAGILFIPLKKK